MEFIFDPIKKVAVIFCTESETLYKVQILGNYSMSSEVENELFERGIFSYGGCGFIVSPEFRESLEKLNPPDEAFRYDMNEGYFQLDYDSFTSVYDNAPDSFQLSESGIARVTEYYNLCLGAVPTEKKTSRTYYDKRGGHYVTEPDSISGWTLTDGTFVDWEEVTIAKYQRPLADQLESERQWAWFPEYKSRCPDAIEWISRYAS